jgi:membrane-bound serine protease (ClpP class)
MSARRVLLGPARHVPHPACAGGGWLRAARQILPWLIVLLASTQPARAQQDSQVFLLKLDGALTQAMALYLGRSLALAQLEQPRAVVLELDTPGGSVDVMTQMVETIRASRVPVVVYVAPRGAIAGSAGAVLTLAGHAAGMAPETVIGAATPVGTQGEDLGETMQKKTEEVIKATMRGLVARRGEEAVALAERMVDQSLAVSAEEALQAGLIDVIAADLPDLLEQLDGRTVVTAQGETILSTRGAEVTEIGASILEQLLQALTNPNFVFLLLTIGVQAILIELSHPGGWVAGFVGVICLALGGYGLGVLPVNWFGAVFMVLAFALFVLDLKAPTHGALTLAGVASFIVGGLVLFNSPGSPSFQHVSVPLVIGSGLVMAGTFLLILRLVWQARRRPVEVGPEALIGRTGEVRTDLNPSGSIQVGGELWSAELEPGEAAAPAGSRVEVVAVRGLRLLVRRSR